MSGRSPIVVGEPSMGCVSITVEIPRPRNERTTHTFHLPEAIVRELISDLQATVDNLDE